MDSNRKKKLDKTYADFLELMLHDLPIERIEDIVADDIIGYGTTQDEKVVEIKRVRQIIIDQREQSAGIEVHWQQTPVHRRINPAEDIAIYTDEFILTMALKEGNHVIPLRLTSVFEFNDQCWKLVHFHASMGVETENDTWHLDEWQKKNEELQRLVDEKTADLVKKNRDLEIEAALEKVRAKSMAMHKSEELRDAATLLYKELRNLGIEKFINCGYVLIDEENNVQNAWMTHTDGTIREVHQMPLTGDDILNERYAMWKKKVPIFKQKVGGEKLRIHNAFASGQNDMEIAPENKLLDLPDPTVFYFGNFSEGYLHLLTEEEFSEESEAILSRFTKVFENTFRRFLDLQKAEAQAREAQVELSLERIRAQVTAMQESSELLDIVVTMNAEFRALGHEAHYFWHMHWLPDTYQKAMTSGDGSRIGMVMELPRGFHEDTRMLEWEKNDDPVGIFTYDADAAIDYVDKMVMLGRFDLVDHNAPGPDDIRAINGLTFVMARTTHGEIGYSLPGEVPDPPEEDLATLVRFAGVFDLAYRRFEDLKNAETQNRETQIELAIERVRAKTMAMNKSDELQDAAMLLFQQLKALRIPVFGCGFNIWDDDRKAATAWMAGEDRIQPPFKTSSSEDIFQRIYEAAERGESLFMEEQAGEALKVHYDYMNSIPVFKEIADKMANTGQSFPTFQIMHCAYFSKGYLMFISYEAVPEAHDIFRRFGKVFEQTYTRFLDLQKAEKQAREAIKQASLERVRGQIASMRNANDLQQITPLIWRELTTLEVPFFRCGIFIINEKEDNVHVYLTTPEGNSLAVLHLPYDFSDLTKNTVDSWRRKAVYQEHWDRDKFVSWTKEMMKIRQIKTAEDYQGDPNPPESLHLHFIPFAQGMLYVGNREQLEDEKIGLVRSLADAFSYAYSRYEDFVVLEEAKDSVEKALSDLKATQSQLIHAEKMASLGELTAGIAHEIQNPLNFVNNFSEVSVDLVDEMIQDMAAGSWQSAGEIADDIKNNLDKISHHGKRASDIVKGMLQHSRNGSGEKSPTDINALADEYLRLAYHGLRAKDKSFNADFRLEADESLPRVSVVPQDIGRVLLNLINNGFYAVNKRSKEENGNYRPSVVIRTKQTGNKIEVRVVDNGNGIPDEIKEKIFQPFFTTKPTGEGTGLGLSMSYDIITKGHHGDLTIDSQVGRGTEFIISLAI